MPVLEETICKCGRAYSHCKAENCGSRNVYVKKFRSIDQSRISGHDITVYGCRRCQVETTSEQECCAPSKEFKPIYKAYQRPKEQMPWDDLIYNTEVYWNALRDFVVKLTEKKHITTLEAYVEAVRQGWRIDEIHMDEDTKEIFRNSGLLDAGAPSGEQSGRAGGHPAEGLVLPTQASESVSLDDIIKNMQENSK